MVDLTTASFELGMSLLKHRSTGYRKAAGQFLTPPTLAHFAAEQLGTIQNGSRVLDPAIGSGTLTCAVIERLIQAGQPLEIWLEGYEIDPELCRIAEEMLQQATDVAARHGIRVHFQVQCCDFILEKMKPAAPLFDTEQTNCSYSHIIVNPPYFKINQVTDYGRAAKGQIKGHTNIYTLFMALTMKLLQPDGTACFIVPRSFCSGTYFADFRQQIISETSPTSVHVFEAREGNFDGVLQENVVFSFQRKPLAQRITISTSPTLTDLPEQITIREVDMQHFLGKRGKKLFFRLPTHELDEQILEALDSWSGTLYSYDLEVSTGPIVPFRLRPFLMDVVEVGKSVPLLWLHHVKAQTLLLNAVNGRQKPRAFSTAPEAQPWLTPTANYVLLRRFTAKEEARRLVAAPFLADNFPYPWVGLENHLNYIYRKNNSLTAIEAVGIAGLLNCGLLDRYFRIGNGNTQVNATELRAMPLPAWEVICAVGERLSAGNMTSYLDEIVTDTLKEHDLLPKIFPIIKETRFA
ncbi:MAG: N-6 DNA methylase [Bacteroidetes bacterium]|nr:MAG: N-6 DNA methylase [Bacteroidota bacterium]